MFAFTQTEKCGKMMAVKQSGRLFIRLQVGMRAGQGGYDMERWENRYAHSRGGAARVVEHSRFERVRSMIMILMAVALIGVGIAGGQAIAFRGKAGDTLVARMLTECNEAISQINTLSRYGGSDSAVIVGKIRAHIHAVDVCNALHASYYGGQLIPQATFTQFYATIDSYMTKLKNGTTTMDEQTTLQTALTALQATLQELK